MWKYKPFVSFLHILNSLECVDDIVIINNNIPATPNDIAQISKVRLINFDSNIKVNAAWNFGAVIARNDKMCILNDDLIIDTNAFVIGEQNCKPGILIGINYDEHSSGDIELVPLNEQRDNAFRWGTCFFVHRQDWTPIPQGLEICYGDNWIGDTIEHRGGQIWVLTGMFVHTPMSVTKTYYTDLDLAREGFIYQHFINQYRETERKYYD